MQKRKHPKISAFLPRTSLGGGGGGGDNNFLKRGWGGWKKKGEPNKEALFAWGRGGGGGGEGTTFLNGIWRFHSKYGGSSLPKCHAS
jgi:hypothetical protein